MNVNQRLLAQMRELAEELCEEDGQRPTRKESRKNNDKNLMRLCGQTARALNLALGSADNLSLRSLTVIHVEPAPDATCLRVWIYAPDHPNPVSALQAAKSWLRGELAHAISRKRVPDLSFALEAQ